MKLKTPMRLLRDRVGISPEEVAVALGVRCASVYNWESGRSEPNLTPGRMLKLVQLYQCSLEELATATEQTQSQQEGAAA